MLSFKQISLLALLGLASVNGTQRRHTNKLGQVAAKLQRDEAPDCDDVDNLDNYLQIPKRFYDDFLEGDSSNLDLYFFDENNSQFVYVEEPNPYIQNYFYLDEDSGSFIPYTGTVEEKIELAYDDLPDCDDVPEFMREHYQAVEDIGAFAEGVVAPPELYFYDEASQSYYQIEEKSPYIDTYYIYDDEEEDYVVYDEAKSDEFFETLKRRHHGEDGQEIEGSYYQEEQEFEEEEEQGIPSGSRKHQGGKKEEFMAYQSAPPAREQEQEVEEQCETAPVQPEVLPTLDNGSQLIYDETTGGYVIQTLEQQIQQRQEEERERQNAVKDQFSVEHSARVAPYEPQPQTYFEESVPPTIFYDEATGGYAVIDKHRDHISRGVEDSSEEPDTYVYYDERTGGYAVLPTGYVPPEPVLPEEIPYCDEVEEIEEFIEEEVIDNAGFHHAVRRAAPEQIPLAESAPPVDDWNNDWNYDWSYPEEESVPYCDEIPQQELVNYVAVPDYAPSFSSSIEIPPYQSVQQEVTPQFTSPIESSPYINVYQEAVAEPVYEYFSVGEPVYFYPEEVYQEIPYCDEISVAQPYQPNEQQNQWQQQQPTQYQQQYTQQPQYQEQSYQQQPNQWVAPSLPGPEIQLYSYNEGTQQFQAVSKPSPNIEPYYIYNENTASFVVYTPDIPAPNYQELTVCEEDFEEVQEEILLPEFSYEYDEFGNIRKVSRRAPEQVGGYENAPPAAVIAQQLDELPYCDEVPEEIANDFVQLTVPQEVVDQLYPRQYYVEGEGPVYYQVSEPSAHIANEASVHYPSIIPPAAIQEIYESLPECEEVPEEIRGSFKEIQSIEENLEQTVEHQRRRGTEEKTYEIQLFSYNERTNTYHPVHEPSPYINEYYFVEPSTGQFQLYEPEIPGLDEELEECESEEEVVVVPQTQQHAVTQTQQHQQVQQYQQQQYQWQQQQQVIPRLFPVSKPSRSNFVDAVVESGFPGDENCEEPEVQLYAYNENTDQFYEVSAPTPYVHEFYTFNEYTHQFQPYEPELPTQQDYVESLPSQASLKKQLKEPSYVQYETPVQVLKELSSHVTTQQVEEYYEEIPYCDEIPVENQETYIQVPDIQLPTQQVHQQAPHQSHHSEATIPLYTYQHGTFIEVDEPSPVIQTYYTWNEKTQTYQVYSPQVPTAYEVLAEEECEVDQ